VACRQTPDTYEFTEAIRGNYIAPMFIAVSADVRMTNENVVAGGRFRSLTSSVSNSCNGVRRRSMTKGKSCPRLWETSTTQ